MTRALFCRKCGEASRTRPLHAEDRAQGRKARHCYVAVGDMPVTHGITINAQFSPMTACHCDLCNDVIPKGAIAVARTMWRGYDEQQPDCWESEFGTVMDEQAVAVLDALTQPKQKDT